MLRMKNWYGAGRMLMGPCAKKVVTFTIVARGGLRFIGTNEVRYPQPACPREPGEGYDKCLRICDQPAHAEVAALNRAGRHANGAIGFLEGISRVCPECQVALDSAGVRAVVFGSPYWEGDGSE